MGGSVYLRGKTWWIRYSWRGKEYRESAHTPDRKKAERFLQARLKAVGTPLFTEPKAQKFTLDDALQKIEQRYINKGNRSFKNVKFCWPHLEAEFRFHRMVDIDEHAIETYQSVRRKAGAEPSTINREVAYLKLGIKLLRLPVPHVEQLEEDNVRTGFLRVSDFNSLLEEIHDQDVKDFVEFLYHSARRSAEPRVMQWSWLDIGGDNWAVLIPKEFTKNKKPLLVPLEGVLKEVIKRRIKARVSTCPYVFHRKGKAIKSFRKAFQAAASKIGMPELVPHDMRRSAIRNFRMAGLSESEGMRLSGHKTNSVYKRYDIISDEDARDAMKKAQGYIKREGQKVVPIKRKRA